MLRAVQFRREPPALDRPDGEPVSREPVSPALDWPRPSKVGPVQLVAISPTVSPSARLSCFEPDGEP